jgi:hypothetical protein
MLAALRRGHTSGPFTSMHPGEARDPAHCEARFGAVCDITPGPAFPCCAALHRPPPLPDPWAFPTPLRDTFVTAATPPPRAVVRRRPVPCSQVAGSSFARCSYTEAIEKLEEAIKGGRKFDNPVWREGLPCTHPHARNRARTHRPSRRHTRAHTVRKCTSSHKRTLSLSFTHTHTYIHTHTQRRPNQPTGSPPGVLGH